MSIWHYADIVFDLTRMRELTQADRCIYCNESLRTADQLDEEIDYGSENEENIQRTLVLLMCDMCGWWFIRGKDSQLDCTIGEVTHLGAASSLRELNLLDDDAPVSEVRSYLMAKYATRFEMSPALFEQVVASVYGSIGYAACVTGRSGDGGIDVVLDGPGGRRAGVQVKRYRNTIKVEQIRAFAGALMLEGYPRGIFVTTSMFQSGAERTARLAAARGYPIELIDAPRFYDALKLAQREQPPSQRDTAQILRSTPIVKLREFYMSASLSLGTRGVVRESTFATPDFDDAAFIIESGLQQSLMRELEAAGKLRYLSSGTIVRIYGFDKAIAMRAIRLGERHTYRDKIFWIRDQDVIWPA